MPLEGIATKSHAMHAGDQVKSSMLLSTPPRLLVFQGVGQVALVAPWKRKREGK